MHQNALPFASNEERLALAERIAGYQPSVAPEDIPATSDRWVLTSNLQKAIRRGLTRTAVATASKLLVVDAPYFWRRLPVIAYEDVGYGNLPLCLDVLKSFRRETLRRQLGVERVALYFAEELSKSLKSRALCDALAAMELCVRRKDFEGLCKDLPDEQLIELACDVQAASMDRIAALRHVCGCHEYSQGRFHTVTRPRPELMREIVHRLDLNGHETLLFLTGQSCSESLNALIPLVATMLRMGEKSEQQMAQECAGANGVLFAALDRHTRVGKRCIAEFIKTKPLRMFFDSISVRDPALACGAAVFMIDGGNLDRWLVFPGSDHLREQLSQCFLEYAGVSNPEAQQELLALVAENLACLNSIRAKVMP